jgi:1-deoxy-D-xylulose-5-phosphate synthase
LADCLRAADELLTKGLPTTVADARFAKPLDVELVLNLAEDHEVLVTIEEGSRGGFGAYVLETLADRGALDHGLKVRTITMPDLFLDHSKPEDQVVAAGLSASGIVDIVLAALGQDVSRRPARA